MTNKHMIWCITAALAAGGVLTPEAFAHPGASSDGMCEELEVPIHFAPEAHVTSEGYVRTAGNYAVRIDRVMMNPCELSVSAARAEETREAVSVEEAATRMRLIGVTVTGRVFDLSAGSSRLPGEGVVIESQMPVDVSLKRARRVDTRQPWRSEEVVSVDYALATELFDEVDWSALGV